MKNVFLLLKIFFILLAIIAAICAAPFAVLLAGAGIAVESINSYLLLESFTKYKTVLDKVPDENETTTP